VHNLGGISNLTFLPGLDDAGVIAFDTGPANALVDEAAGSPDTATTTAGGWPRPAVCGTTSCSAGATIRT
jgi:1,6-anhydro-N-acetylmuramate kinase